MNWRAARTKGQIQSNFLGNSAKSMHVSIEDSLKKLRTDYIDIVRQSLFPAFARKSLCPRNCAMLNIFAPMYVYLNLR